RATEKLSASHTAILTTMGRQQRWLVVLVLLGLCLLGGLLTAMFFWKGSPSVQVDNLVIVQLDKLPAALRDTQVISYIDQRKVTLAELEGPIKLPVGVHSLIGKREGKVIGTWKVPVKEGDQSRKIELEATSDLGPDAAEIARFEGEHQTIQS